MLTEEREGEIRRKIVDEKQFLKMKMTTRKSWSWRSLRWLNKMPQTLRDMDPIKKGTKIELKKWVRGHIPVRGCRIMWGKKLEGEAGVRRHRGGSQNDRERDGHQEQLEEMGGEENEVSNEEDNRPRDVEGGHNTTPEMQGPANTVSCLQTKNMKKNELIQAMKLLCGSHSQGAQSKRNKKKSRRCVDNPQNSRERGQLTTSLYSWATGGCGREGQGRGPWKPAWPPPREKD